MKRFLVIVFLVTCSGIAFAQNIPKPMNPPRLVNDFAGVLSPEQTQILEDRLVALDDSTSNQIAIVTVKTMGNYDDLESYSLKILRDWGIGGKKNNNGVLIFVATEDKKTRIEVGYGLEGPIPDIIANDIVQNDLLPNFKNKDYYRGFDEAITALGKAAAGEYSEKRTRNNDGGGSGILVFIIILFIVLMIVGRGKGGRGGGMMSRRGYGGWWVPLLFNGGWGGGNRGGGGWSGGGGFGGGGFGGFGGGSGGGGGASGSW